eukprot:12170135-Alexandrium_andersonii.AAC.1
MERDVQKALLMFERGKVVTVKRVQKLGSHAISELRLHFEQFGRVDHVWVPRSPLGCSRPSCIGYIVMGSVESAQSARAAGDFQD